MHDVPAQVGQLFFVDPGGVAEHIALPGRQQHVLVHGMVHLVDGGLAILHHVDVAKTRRAVLFHEQRIEYEGVLPVVVQAPLCQCRVVLAGVQHHPVAELAVVQHHVAAFVRALIVPVHHHTAGSGVRAVLVDVAGHIEDAGGVACQLWVAGRELCGVLQAQAEKIR